MIKKTGDDKTKNVISVLDPKEATAKVFCECGVPAPITKEAFMKNEKPSQICPSCGKKRK